MGSALIRKAIAQEDIMGCGIACVAFICGIRYRRAKHLLFENPCDARTKGYYCRDIIRALSKAGKTYQNRFLKNGVRRVRYPDRAIAFIARSKRYPSGHYLARLQNRWMDPWINFPLINGVRGGFRKRLPGKVKYLIYPIKNERK